MKISRFVLPACLAALLSSAPAFASAQTNRPLTGNMMDPPQPAQTYPLDSTRGQPTPFGDDTVTGKTVAAPSPAPTQVAQVAPPAEATSVATAPVAEQPAPAKKRQFGDTTRDLLKLQASGDAAGKQQPILGDEASASYKRYLDSFNHPLPEYYQTAVKAQGNGGR